MAITVVQYPLGGGQFGTLFIGDTNANSIVGTSGIDTFRGGLGNDTFDGRAGFDIADFSKSFASYQLSWAGTSLLVRDIATGETDTLKNIERLTFNGVAYNVADLGPVARNDSATGIENSPIVVNVLANDTAVGGSPLHIQKLGGGNAAVGDVVATTATPYGLLKLVLGANNTVVLNAGSQLDGLAAGKILATSFSYTVKDGAGRSSNADIAIKITGVNDAPAAATDQNAAVNSVAEGAARGTAVGITAHALDPDGTVTYALANNAGGRFAINALTGVVTVANGALIDFESAPNKAYVITVRASDGTAVSTRDFTIGVRDVNEAPTVTAGGAVAFTENGAGVAVDPTITIVDADDTHIESATVQITGNYASGQDRLMLGNTGLGITATFNAATGMLTLTGHASKAAYELALESVRFENTSENPSTGARTVTFKVSDGSLTSTGTTATVTVHAVNDAPILNATSGTAAYTEGGNAVRLDAGLTVSDFDSTQLKGAVVKISGNFSAADGDRLNFANQGGISGTYNAATGVLTLTGTASLAAYQAALRTITFSLTSDSPSTATRAISFQVTDGGNVSSVVDTRLVSIAATNDAPTVTVTGGPSAYTENAAGAVVDRSLVVGDADSANLTGATVKISTGFVTGDQLLFTLRAGVTGIYDAATGVLTLTGSATVSDYQQILRDIQFSSTSDNPGSTRGITFQVTDGALVSTIVTKPLDVTAINDAPVINGSGGATAYVEGGVAVAVNPGLTIADPDSTTLSGASVKITGNFSASDLLSFSNQNGITGTYDAATGELTLSGTASLAAYQAALRSITFSLSSDDPSTATRTVSIVTFDSANLGSNAITRDISVTATNDAPTVSPSAGANAFTEGGVARAIDTSLVVSDADNADLQSATVSIGQGFVAGDQLNFVNQNGITGVYNSITGVLTLTGAASVALYQAALRSILFSSASDDPGTSRSITYSVNDGSLDSTLQTKALTVVAVNDAPSLTATGTNPAYIPGADLFSGVSASTIESGQKITGLTLSVTSVSGNDESLTIDGVAVSLNTGSVGLPSGFTATVTRTGGDVTVTITSSAGVTPASIASLLDGMTYTNAMVGPAEQPRVITVTSITDNGGQGNGGVDTTALNLTSTVTFNQAPVLGGAGGTVNYTENGSGSIPAASISITDTDDANLTGATVKITGNFDVGKDVLVLGNTGLGITAVYDAATGTLTLSGTATKADYETALESVTYRNSSDDPDAGPRTVTYTVTDGTATSNAVTATVDVIAVNDAPAVVAGTTLAYTENQGAAAIAPGLVLTDPDNTQMTGASVQITGFQSGDVLSALATGTISASYDSATGILTLTGTDTVAHYQAVLRSVTYSSISESPDTTPRTITYSVTDGTLTGTATSTVNVTSVDDASVITAPATLVTNEDQSVNIAGTQITVNDADNGTVTVTLGVAHGSLTLTQTTGLSFGGGDGTGDATMTFTGTLANVNAALNGLTYSPTANFNTSQGAETIGITVNTASGGPVTSSVAVTVNSVNDAPTGSQIGVAAPVQEDTAYVFKAGDFAVSDASDSPANTLSAVKISSLPGTGTLLFDGVAITSQQITAGFFVSLADLQAGKFTYEPAANDFGFSYSFTFQVRDNGGTANGGIDLDPTPRTFSLLVGGVNDEPVLTGTGGALTYTEDSPSEDHLLDLFSGVAIDTVESGQTVTKVVLTVTNVTDATEFLRIGAANYGLVNGTATVGGMTIAVSKSGSTATVTITSSPGLAPASMATLIDGISYLNTGENPTAGPRVITITEVVDSGSNVAPNDNTSVPGVSTTVTVAPTDDPTVVDLFNNQAGVQTTGTAAQFNQAGPVAVVPLLALSDVDNTTVASAAVTLTNAHTGDVVTFNGQTGTGTYAGGIAWTVSSTGVTFTGIDSIADYQAAMALVQYSNSSATPDTTGRTFSISVNGSLSATATVSVNAPPSITSDGGNATAAVAVAENTTAVTVVTATDADNQPSPITYSIINGDDSAKFSIIASGVGAGTLRFVNAPDFESPTDIGANNTYVVTVQAWDGAAFDQQTITVTVTNVNEAPALAATSTVGYTEGGTGVVLAPAMDVNDDGLIGSAKITIGNRVSGDILNFTNTANITGNFVAATGILTLTGNATVAQYEAALQSITFSSTSVNPTVTNTVLTRSISWQVTDAGNIASNTVQTSINVTGINVAPVAGNDTYTETAVSTPFTVSGNAVDKIILAANGLRVNDSDGDGDPLQVIIVSQPDNGTVTVNNDGSFTWMPRNGFERDTSFTYKLFDGQAYSNVATVTIDVPPPDPLRSASSGEAVLTYFPRTFTLPGGKFALNDQVSHTANDTNGRDDIYIQNGSTYTLVNHTSNPLTPSNIDGGSRAFAVSSSGGVDKVWFFSSSTNMPLTGTSTTNGSALQEIFSYNVQTGEIQRAITLSNGAEIGTSGGSISGIQDFASVSANGRWLVFQSQEQALTTQGNIFGQQTYMKDMQTGAVTVVSVRYSDGNYSGFSGGLGAIGNNGASISPNGRFVAFSSDNSDIVAGDTNGKQDIFVWDRGVNLDQGPLGHIDRFELPTIGNAQLPIFSPDGTALVFQANANLPGNVYYALDLSDYYLI